jgi:hypothetical protein
MRLNISRLRVRISLAAAALAAAASPLAIAATPAAAAAASYCKSSSCDLASQPYTGYIYFEMPRLTALTMICWTDTQWYDGTNRWFKVKSIYGTGYTSANEVGNQARVGHC